MNITELTPPAQRMFSLELSEDELKTLATIMGNMSFNDIQDQVEKAVRFVPVVVTSYISHDIYSACYEIFYPH